MNGQISIFDFPEYLPEEKMPNKVVPEECKQCVDIGKIYDSNGKYEIDIYHCGIDGHPTKTESGRPGTKCIKNHIYKHSGHTCNKEEPKQKIINDYEWHSINTPPQEGQYCEFEYTWSMYHTDDRKGICTGWWNNGKVQWQDMPMDICKKTLVRWRLREEGLKPIFGIVICEHDHKALCNRWHGGDEEIKKAKSDLINGFSCSGCCYYCSEAPMHGGKCKWDCRYYKEKQ